MGVVRQKKARLRGLGVFEGHEPITVVFYLGILFIFFRYYVSGSDLLQVFVPAFIGTEYVNLFALSYTNVAILVNVSAAYRILDQFTGGHFLFGGFFLLHFAFALVAHEQFVHKEKPQSDNDEFEHACNLFYELSAWFCQIFLPSSL